MFSVGYESHIAARQEKKVLDVMFGRYETVKVKIANIETSLNIHLRNETRKSEWRKLHFNNFES